MTKRAIPLTTLAFIAIGPLIGALLVMVWASLAANGTRLPTVREVTLMAPPVIAYAYVFGFLPAAGAGIVWGILSTRLSKSRQLTWLQRASLGVGLGGLFGAATGQLWDWASSTDLERTALLFPCTLCGAMAGLLLCPTFPRGGWLHRGPSNPRLERPGC
jgi:hypothetical protein